MWAAAQAASFNCQLAEVFGWCIKWRPRNTPSCHGKIGDMYITQPRDAYAVSSGGATIRSLTTLREVLLRRKAAQEGGGVPELFVPPMRDSLVDVRLSAAEMTDNAINTDGNSIESAWCRARVCRVDWGLGGSFQVVLYDAAVATDKSWTRWCDANNENTEWRRIAGAPLVVSAPPGTRKRRCGQCANCLQRDCGKCSACLDKPKFGGTGMQKQACKRRECSMPTVPTDGPWLSQGREPKDAAVAGKESIVGHNHQAEPPHVTLPSVRPFPADPPHCYCARPAVWSHKRWWCADELNGCDLELKPPPHERTPLCDCHQLAAWDERAEAWCCVRLPSLGGCGFSQAEAEPPMSPVQESHAAIAREQAARTAKLLTAAPHNSNELPDPESDAENDLAEDITCRKCGSADEDHALLLCDGDGCTAAFHTFCLTPPLKRVPTGKWFCAACASKANVGGRQRSAKVASSRQQVVPAAASTQQSSSAAPARKDKAAGTMTATEEHTVDHIIAAQGQGRKRRYLVKWEGYDDEAENTWEPAEHLHKKLIADFEREQGNSEHDVKRPRRNHRR